MHGAGDAQTFDLKTAEQNPGVQYYAVKQVTERKMRNGKVVRNAKLISIWFPRDVYNCNNQVSEQSMTE